MMFEVHFYNVGRSSETAFHVLSQNMKVDKVYLLNNYDPKYVEVEQEIVDKLRAVNVDDVSKLSIDIYDFDDIYKKVCDTARAESDAHNGNVRFHFNITMGTSIVVGAVCCAAMVLDADLYYIKGKEYSESGKDEFISIPIENIPEVEKLRKKKAVLGVFLRFRDYESISNSALKGDGSSARLSYITRELQLMGLIERRGSVKDTVWTLTEKGRNALKRI